VLALVIGAMARGQNAPPSPSQPWSPRGLNDYQTDLASRKFAEDGVPVKIDPEKVYGLPDLIDIAERSNPNTRIAWEHARAAAAAVGLAQSAYYPYLAASAGAGYEHAFIPFPSLSLGPGTDVSITGGNTLSTGVVAERAALSVKWLLFDFGERKAVTTATKERLMMANVGFNAVHQQVVFDVTRRFYELNTAREKVGVTERALAAAKTVGEAAEARFAHGLGTKPEALQADQQAAEAAFELEAARGALSDAQVALVESLGLLPTTELRIAEIGEEPKDLAESLDSLIDRALSQRPDLFLKLAELRARQAEVRQAQSAYYPKIALDAHGGWAGLDVSIKNSPYFGGDEPVYGVGLALEWPIFDGYLRENKKLAAEAELRAAENELAEARDSAVRQVWKSYTDLQTALRKRESAAKLVAAAESAYAASLDAYKHGLGTYVDAVNAERDVAAARSVGVDTRAAIFTGEAALAFSVGELDKPAARNPSGKTNP